MKPPHEIEMDMAEFPEILDFSNPNIQYKAILDFRKVLSKYFRVSTPGDIPGGQERTTCSTLPHTS